METSLGDSAAALLRELKAQSRAETGGLLPPYNEASLQKIIREINWLWEHNNSIIEQNAGKPIADETKIALYTNHTAIHRNKRSGLVYLNFRLQQIRELLWGAGMVLTSEMKTNLSPPEEHFIHEYQMLVTEYKRSSGVNLSEDLLPPKDVLILVESDEDLGSIETSRGAITFKPGTRQYLPRVDAEHLIRMGKVRPV
eukprot:TRINITY_DN20312_c0_g1_i1.p1 TRINITY_DN20312_c0_g1~~TRINITY_DN20312_c0_g1_i1.p1  ORF type:complete len:198 (+),score=34.10 TRINITY_DN20312_c0_g1_i1:176-769(+)